jgi:Skp family chaperone for outer membrane proteins
MPTTRRLSAAALSALASLVLLIGAFAGVADARPNPAPPAFKACDNTKDTPANVPFCDEKDDDSKNEDEDDTKQEESDEDDTKQEESDEDDTKQEESDEDDTKQEESDEDESKDEDEDESKQEESDEDESKDEDEVQGQQVIRQSNDGSGSNTEEQGDDQQGDDADVRGTSAESAATSADEGVGVAGASESAPTTLPRTGVGSLSMLLAALGMMAGGFSLTQFARRES